MRGFLISPCSVNLKSLTSTFTENINHSSFYREKVLVLHIGTVKPHEFHQPLQIFSVVTRVAAANGNLGCNLLVRGRAEVNGVVGGGDVDEGQQGVLIVLFGDELHHLCVVAPKHHLSDVQILERFFNLGFAHFIGNTPCASLGGERKKGK